VALDHARLALRLQGDTRKTALEFRKHFGWYTKGVPGAATLREQLFRVESMAEAETVFAAYLAGGWSRRRHDTGRFGQADRAPSVRLDRSPPARHAGAPGGDFCQGKTPAQVVAIAERLERAGAGGEGCGTFLATRAEPVHAEALHARFPGPR